MTYIPTQYLELSHFRYPFSTEPNLTKFTYYVFLYFMLFYILLGSTFRKALQCSSLKQTRLYEECFPSSVLCKVGPKLSRIINVIADKCVFLIQFTIGGWLSLGKCSLCRLEQLCRATLAQVT